MQTESRSKTGACVLAIASAALLFAGCSGLESDGGAGLKRSEGMSRRLAGTRTDQAFDAAVYAMRQWFTRVEPRPTEGLVRGVSFEYVQKGGTERLRDAIGFKNRLRRTGRIVVRPYDVGCIVVCRIDRDRLDTADHRVFRQNETINDLPSETPIEREAGVSAEQQQAWTPMPRDRALERMILDLVRDRAASTSADGS